VLRCLNRSATYQVNNAIDQLRNIVTTSNNEELSSLQWSSPTTTTKSGEKSNNDIDSNGNSNDGSATLLRRIQINYADFDGMLHDITQLSSLLRYDDACLLLLSLITKAQQIRSLVDTFVLAANNHQCRTVTSLSSSSSSSTNIKNNMASRLLSSHDAATLTHNEWSVSIQWYIMAAIIIMIALIIRLLRPSLPSKPHVN
jgi:hypothetical protein